MPNETLAATIDPKSAFVSFAPPGRATSRISSTTITGLENSPPYAPAKPESVLTPLSSASISRRSEPQPATPPPQPKSELLNQLFPTPVSPMNARPTNAPQTPSATAEPMSTQNSRL